MTLLLIALAAVLLGPQPHCAPSRAEPRALIHAADNDAHQSLKALCASLFEKMNDKNEGIFHEDISAAVAPYFPAGQPIAETRKVIAEQKLGELRAFKGKMMASETAPFATSFRLMGAQYSQVEVVLHFDFKGDSDSNYTVKSVHAYFRGTSM